MKTAKGYSWIEWLIAIIALGAFAAYSIPKYFHLTTDSRINAVRSLEGDIRNAVNLSLSKAKADGYVRHRFYAGSNITGDPLTSCPSEDKTTIHCYVYGNPAARLNGIVALIDKTVKIMEEDAPCRDTWHWCYYKPRTVANNDDEVIYISPSNSAGYISGNLANSCTLEYRVIANITENSTVVITPYLGGC